MRARRFLPKRSRAQVVVTVLSRLSRTRRALRDAETPGVHLLQLSFRQRFLRVFRLHEAARAEEVGDAPTLRLEMVRQGRRALQSIDALEPEITEFVSGLLDDLAPRGECDLMRDFAMQIPLFVIARMLGVNPDDGLMFRGWVEVLTMGTFQEADPEDHARVGMELAEYFRREIAQRKAALAAGEPLEQDLITRLLTAEVDGKTLEPARVMGFISFLLIAGSGTTTMLICNAIAELLNHPDQMAKVVANPDLVPALIEESMRYTAPVHGLFRTNNEETELHGVTIPKDSKTLCLFAAANHDDSVFPNPEVFDIERPMGQLRKQLGFGWGTHICVGAPLARMEARIAFEQIFARLPNLRANGPAKRTDPSVLYGYDNLPVAWDT